MVRARHKATQAGQGRCVVKQGGELGSDVYISRAIKQNVFNRLWGVGAKGAVCGARCRPPQCSAGGKGIRAAAGAHEGAGVIGVEARCVAEVVRHLRGIGWVWVDSRRVGQNSKRRKV